MVGNGSVGLRGAEAPRNQPWESIMETKEPYKTTEEGQMGSVITEEGLVRTTSRSKREARSHDAVEARNK